MLRWHFVRLVVLLVQVIAGINQKLQLLVEEAQSVAASGGSDTAVKLLGLQTQISKLASVQQEQVLPRAALLAADLAAKLATDPAYDASVDLAVFTDVSRVCMICMCMGCIFMGWMHMRCMRSRPCVRRLRGCCDAHQCE
jgi:hypothetical protein